MKKLRQIAIYGGAFDPPHNGHLSIIHQLASMDFLDEVWLLPSGDRNDKKLVLSMDHRSQLLKKLTDNCCQKKVIVNYDQIQLSRQKKRMIPTIQFFKHLNSKYIDSQFYFTVGGDILSTINTWQQHEKILQEINFIIFPRRGYSLNQDYMPKTYFLSPFVPQQISSSYIKKVLLDQNIDKNQKYELVGKFLENKTIQMLRQQGYF